MPMADLPSRFDLRQRPLQLALLAMAALLWGIPFAAGTAWRLRFEDAMIVLRYARNLAAGEGFVFNPGEKILGITTPLQTLLSTGIYLLGGGADAPAWQNLAGLLFLVAEAFLLLLLLHRLGLVVAALPVALLGLAGFFGGYLYLGMETHLFMALVLLALLLSLAETPRPAWLGFVLGLAFLTRYDAALLAGLIGFAAWWRDRRFPWRMTFVFAAVVAPWLLFAQLYFGSILPQPLAAKESYFTAAGYLQQVYGQWRETVRAICAVFSRIDRANHLVAVFFPLPLVAGALWLAREARFRVLALYPFLHLAVYAAIGSDPGFTWHLYPLGPFALLFGAASIAAVLGWLRPRLGARLPPALGASALIVALLVPLGWHLFQQARYRFEPDPHTGQLLAMAAFLKDRYPPTTSLLQPSIGILGYETGFRMIDHAGLITPGLYFWNDSDCTPLEEVLARYRPDLVLASPWTKTPAEAMVAAGYENVHTFTDQPFLYVLWERKVPP